MRAAAAGPIWLITRSATGGNPTGAGRLPDVKSEVVVYDQIPFSEGPVWCADGTLVVTSVAAGALYRVWPNEQRAEVCAQTDGGANGAALAADGAILVAQ